VLEPAAIRPVHFCDVTVDGALWPVFGWTIETTAGTVLVDTGMIDSTPELDAEWGPVLREWPDLGDVVAVVNTHLHFDHCGGNRRFAGTPTYVQRAELEAAVEPDYLVRWVHFDGESYVELDGDGPLFEDVSVLFTPGHSVGHQAVVVDTTAGLVVLGGDVTHSMDELVAGGRPEIDRVHALRPHLVYLAHDARPWQPDWSQSD
jgi:N-acyl homoserine lactone hydrolase